jgi:hypothetical protein
LLREKSSGQAGKNITNTTCLILPCRNRISPYFLKIARIRLLQPQYARTFATVIKHCGAFFEA